MAKKIFTMALMLILTVCFCLVLPHGAIAKDKPIKWRMSTTWVSSNDFINNDIHFANIIEEMSGGRLKIHFSPGGEVVPAVETLSAVQKNVLQASGDWPGFWIGKNTAFNVLAGFPFAPRQMDYMTWIWANGGFEIYNEVYNKFGIMYFPHHSEVMESGIRGISNSRKLKSLKDFKGTKIRMAGRLQGYILKELGAAPVNVTPAEIYQALDRGLLDFADYSMPHIDWSLGLHEVTNQWNVPGWHQTGSVLGVMINKKAYEALPKDLQAIVKYAAQATMIWSSGRAKLLSGSYTKKWLERGTEVNELDPEALKQMQEIAYQGILKESKDNPLYAKAAYLFFKTAEVTHAFDDVVVKSYLGVADKFPDLEAIKKSAGSLLNEETLKEFENRLKLEQ